MFGEFLRKRKRILQVHGKLLIHKKLSNRFSIATYKKNILFSPELALRNVLGSITVTFLVLSLDKVDLAE